MKNLSLIAGCFLLATPALAQQNTEKTYTVPVSDASKPVTLEVDIRHGRVVVQGGNNEDVTIIAKTRPLNTEELADVRKNNFGNWNHNNQPAKESRSREGLKPVQNAMLNMEIEQSGNNIEVSSEESTYYVDLVINVPQNTHVEAEMYRGDGITVSNVTGYLELGSWRGDIIAEQIRGPIVAETHQNTIVANFAEFSEASPSSLTTHSGDIDITVSANMAANINVQNFRGEILSGIDAPFNATEQVQRKEGEDKRQIVIGGQLTAKLNNGGQDLTLITYNGDVYVRKP